MATMKWTGGGLALAASFMGTTSVSAAPQHAAPLAPGEVLLQMHETGTTIEPIGTVRTICLLSASGKSEEAALAALTSNRNILTRQISGTGEIEEIGTPDTTIDYDAETMAANAVADAAADAAAADTDAAATDAVDVSEADAAAAAAVAAAAAAADAAGRRSAASSWKASQSLALRLTRFSQITTAAAAAESMECAGLHGGYRSYARGSAFPLVTAQDPVGAEARAFKQGSEAARKRADLYAASMGMKILRTHRISEVGEIGAFLGEDMTKSIKREMTYGNRSLIDPYFLQDKIRVEKELFIDFVMAPK